MLRLPLLTRTKRIKKRKLPDKIGLLTAYPYVFFTQGLGAKRTGRVVLTVWTGGRPSRSAPMPWIRTFLSSTFPVQRPVKGLNPLETDEIWRFFSMAHKAPYIHDSGGWVLSRAIVRFWVSLTGTKQSPVLRSSNKHKEDISR